MQFRHTRLCRNFVANRPILGLFLLLIAVGKGLAQQSTSATYGDWVVRCATQGQPPQKTCDMEQLTRVQDQANPLSRVSVTRPAQAQPPKIVIQLPVNISLQTPVKIQTADKDPGIAAPFQRCAPGGCIAFTDLNENVLKKFRALAGRGTITFKDAAEHDVSIPLSFNGFSTAYDALLKQ